MPNRNVEGNYRYKFQGQEKDPETGMEAFQLRLWDSRIGRWLSPDPYNQYFSPYLGMGNNPINGIDPDGGCFTTDTDGNTIPCPDMGVGSSMTGSAGYEWTMQDNGWAMNSTDFANVGVDLGMVSKPFNLGNWISNHIYFNAEAGIDFGTQVGVNIKALGGKVALNYKKDVNPLIKLGISHDNGWDFTAVPNGPNSGYNSKAKNEKNEWNIGGVVGFGKEYTSSKGFLLSNGLVKSETSDWIIISITEEIHTSGVHKGMVKNRKFGWGIGADLSILLGVNFDLSGGFQFKTKYN